MKKKLGIIGFGRFGQFMALHLRPFFDITIFDLNADVKMAKKLKVKIGSFVEVGSLPIICIACPNQLFDEVSRELAKVVKKDALVFDIGSVKMLPHKVLTRNLKNKCRLVLTHPLFGPQSARDTIVGKNFVICSPKSNKDALSIAKFAKEKLKLNILWRTPAEHDQEMAYSQGITHFLGKAINELKFPPAEEKTAAYKNLMDLALNVSKDTPSLFMALMKENPYAKKIRKQFIKKLIELDQKIEKER